MPSLPELLSLIDLFYESALDATTLAGGDRFRDRRAFGGDSALLSLHVARECTGWKPHRTSSPIQPLKEINMLALIAEPDLSATWAVINGCLPSGAATTSIVAHGAPNFERTRFYDEWLRPQPIADFILAPLAPARPASAACSSAAPDLASTYGQDDVDAMRLLQPHLNRACQIRERLARLRVIRGQRARRTCSARSHRSWRRATRCAGERTATPIPHCRGLSSATAMACMRNAIDFRVQSVLRPLALRRLVSEVSDGRGSGMRGRDARDTPSFGPPSALSDGRPTARRAHSAARRPAPSCSSMTLRRRHDGPLAPICVSIYGLTPAEAASRARPYWTASASPTSRSNSV